MEFLKTLIHTIIGQPDATKIGRAVRGFLASIGGSAIVGISDVIAQVVSQLADGGAVVIDWHLVARTVIVAVVPTLLAWLTMLAAYLRGLSEETPQ